MYNTRILVGITQLLKQGRRKTETTCIVGSKSDDNINIVTIASVP